VYKTVTAYSSTQPHAGARSAEVRIVGRPEHQTVDPRVTLEVRCRRGGHAAFARERGHPHPSCNQPSASWLLARRQLVLSRNTATDSGFPSRRRWGVMSSTNPVQPHGARRPFRRSPIRRCCGKRPRLPGVPAAIIGRRRPVLGIPPSLLRPATTPHDVVGAGRILDAVVMWHVHALPAVVVELARLRPRRCPCGTSSLHGAWSEPCPSLFLVVEPPVVHRLELQAQPGGLAVPVREQDVVIHGRDACVSETPR